MHGINRFLDRIYADQDPGPEPKDTRGDLWQPVLDEVARLSAAGEHAEARRRFRPAWEPFAERTIGAPIAHAYYVDDAGRIVVRVGQAHQDTVCLLVDDDGAHPLPGILDVGRSPDRRFFARVYADRIDVSDGWDGPAVVFRLPTHYKPVYDARALAERTIAIGRLGLESVTVWPDGARVLLVTTTGIFVCYPDKDAALLWPTGTRVAEGAGGDDRWDAGLSYAHAALSADGRYLAFGDQDSLHLVMRREGTDAKTLTINPVSEYPNAACFHGARGLVALASCHFARSGVVQHAPASIDAHFAGDGGDDSVILTGVHWVFAIAARDEGWILGDRNGYLWHVDTAGTTTGYVHLGSTCLSLDVSADGRRVLAGMFAGHLVELAYGGDRSIDLITNMKLAERRRWVFTDRHGPVRW
jgi:hypothetical protein